MLSEAEQQEFAALLFKAERQRTYIRPLTETHPQANIEDAYAIAQRVAELKLSEGLIVKGHKIGLASKAMQKLAGSSEPDFGTLFNDQFVPEDSELSLSSFNNALGVEIELELACVLRDDLIGPTLTPADAMRAVDYVVPALEVVDRRYLVRRGPGAITVDSVADGAWCGAVVLGSRPRRLDQFDVRAVVGTVRVNDEPRAEGVSSAVLGSPINSLTWLANTLGRSGVTMRAGHVIMTGSFIELVSVRPGDLVVADLDAFGPIKLQIAT